MEGVTDFESDCAKTPVKSRSFRGAAFEDDWTVLVQITKQFPFLGKNPSILSRTNMLVPVLCSFAWSWVVSCARAPTSFAVVLDTRVEISFLPVRVLLMLRMEYWRGMA